MSHQDLTQANIENLTQLWNLMGRACIETKTTAVLSASIYWPGRLWFNFGHYPSDSDIDTLLLACEQDDLQMIIPLWHSDDEQFKLRLQSAGYSPFFTQTAMVLDMHTYQHQSNVDINTTQVTTEEDMTKWIESTATAFGYEVRNPSLYSLLEQANVDFYLTWHEDRAIGTALIYKTETITGIHQVGILPKYRGFGLAQKMMCYLLNLINKTTCRYVTLQASTMGESLYKKLGFQPQFTITNYGHNSLIQKYMIHPLHS